MEGTKEKRGRDKRKEGRTERREKTGLFRRSCSLHHVIRPGKGTDITSDISTSDISTADITSDIINSDITSDITLGGVHGRKLLSGRFQG